MCRAIRTAFFLVCINIVPSVIVILIIVKMKTGIDVFEGILWHALHASANCIEQLACQPSTLVQWITPQTLRKLASKKAPNVVSNDDLLVGRMIILWRLPFGFDAV
jgi:hypothetical protein